MSCKQLKKSSITEESPKCQKKLAFLVSFPDIGLKHSKMYRLKSDIHLCSAEYDFRPLGRFQIVKSPLNAYKRISGVSVNRGRVVIRFGQIDLDFMPEKHLFGTVFDDPIENSLIKYQQHLEQALGESQIKKEHLKYNYRSKVQYQYKYITEFDQFVINSIAMDIQLIEDLGFTVKQFMQICFSLGLPEYNLIICSFTIRPNMNHQEYMDSIQASLLPIIDPSKESEIVFYSYKYPNGLRAQQTNQVNSVKENQLEIDTFYNYSILQQSYLPDERKYSVNCLMKYYTLKDHQIKRCGYQSKDKILKKIKNSDC